MDKQYNEDNEIKDLEVNAIKCNNFFGTSGGSQFGSDRAFESYQANQD